MRTYGGSKSLVDRRTMPFIFGFIGKHCRPQPSLFPEYLLMQWPISAAYLVHHEAPLYLHSGVVGPRPIMPPFGVQNHHKRVICYCSRVDDGMVQPGGLGGIV